MAKTFTVKAHIDARSEDDHGVPYLVGVFEAGNPGIVGHLRVLHFEEEGVNLLRIVWAQLTSEDEDAAVHETLNNGAWWDRALDAVLDHIIFNSPAVDHAVDHDGGRLEYGWVGGEVQESTLLPTEDAETPQATCDLGNSSMAWASKVFEPGADITEEQLERFFDDIARLLAEKAFGDGSEDGQGGDRGGPVGEGGGR